jgi:hypothetical protein
VLQANNLSDLTSASDARANLGLGSANPIEHYKERSLQIAHEALYTFQYLSKIRAKK